MVQEPAGTKQAVHIVPGEIVTGRVGSAHVLTHGDHDVMYNVEAVGLVNVTSL